MRRALIPLVLCGAVTLPAQAETLPGWAAALASGEERLVAFALSQAQPEGAGPLLARTMARLGGAHDPAGPALQPLGVTLTAWPVVEATRNFNGGIPADTIRIGPFDFEVAPADRARSGIVGGAGAGLSWSASLGTGSVLTLSSRAASVALLGEGLSRSEVSVDGCLRHVVTGWTWLDGCTGVAATRTSGQRDVVQRSLSLGPVIVTRAGGLDQQWRLTARHRDRADFAQTSLALDWTGAVPDLGALSLGAEWGQQIAGQNLPVRGLSAGLARPFAGRPARLRLSVQETAGAQFLGRPRRDMTVAVSGEVMVRPGLTVSADLGRRNSSADPYDEVLGGLSLRIDR